MHLLCHMQSARSLIGQRLEVGVIDFSPDAPKMTVSPRQALRCRAQRSLTAGKLVYGTVVHVSNVFGVGLDCLHAALACCMDAGQAM